MCAWKRLALVGQDRKQVVDVARIEFSRHVTERRRRAAARYRDAIARRLAVQSGKIAQVARAGSPPASRRAGCSRRLPGGDSATSGRRYATASRARRAAHRASAPRRRHQARRDSWSDKSSSPPRCRSCRPRGRPTLRVAPAPRPRRARDCASRQALRAAACRRPGRRDAPAGMRARARRDRGRGRSGIERQAFGIDVRKHRTRAGHHHRERGVRGRQRRRDHFIAGTDVECAQDQRDRVGAGADADGVRTPGSLRRTRASNASTSGPSTNQPLAMTRSIARP